MLVQNSLEVQGKGTEHCGFKLSTGKRKDVAAFVEDTAAKRDSVSTFEVTKPLCTTGDRSILHEGKLHHRDAEYISPLRMLGLEKQ